MHVAGQTGDDAAESYFRQAITTAQRQGAKSLEWRAAARLARLLLRQDRADEAYNRPHTVYAWFSEGFDTHDTLAAAALLQQM
ncbi:MAG: hypothetical protein ACU837_16685 [Gammaproteobacteria bacterium]